MVFRSRARASTHDLGVTCRCGEVTGRLTRAGPRVGDHVVCHCTDCQTFARRLEAEWVLDDHGGTALYQGRCATMRLTTGTDRLACFHLTDKPTLRWCAVCCGTPMFNTYRNGRVPVLTILVATLDPSRREAALGPPIGHLFVKEAVGDASDLEPLSTAGMMRRYLPRMIADIVSGDRRRAALFDAKTLQPIATPQPAGDPA